MLEGINQITLVIWARSQVLWVIMEGHIRCITAIRQRKIDRIRMGIMPTIK